MRYIDHKLDVSYLCVIFWKYYYYYYYYHHRCCCCMYFIVTTHSVLCLLLSNDQFCTHFGGSLEYWINEYDWISVSSPVSLSHCWQSYNLLYTVHFDPVPSPAAQCLITSHSLSFHPIYTVVTITSNCELSFVTDLCMLVPSYFLFLCYVHSSSCCINNTSFVATTTATTINLFTPTSLHVVAPHCAAPTLLSVEAADDGITFDFQHNSLHSFS